MKAVYDICLTYFSIENGTALACPGKTNIGRVGSLELLQILMIFQDISPVQHFEGEPTITITTRQGDRHLVRTDLNKLILVDVRNTQNPSRVLEAASILLEIEDRSGSLRKMVNSSLNEAAHLHRDQQEGAAHKEGPVKVSRGSIVGFFVCLLLLGAAVLLREVPLPPPAPDQLVTDAHDVVRLRQLVIGTYVTGNAAGDYGIVVLPTGELRFLELGGRPPAECRASYDLGYRDNKLCLVVPGYQLIYLSRDTLVMGDLVFFRR